MIGKLNCVLVATATLAAASGCAALLTGDSQGQGILSPQHEANIGKIVFATQEIAKDANGAPPLASEIDVARDEIWGRIYLAKPLSQVTSDVTGKDCPRGRADIWVKRGASLIRVGDTTFTSKSWQHWTTFRPTRDGEALLSRKQYALPKRLDKVRLANYLATLPQGKHTVQLLATTVCDGKTIPLANGDLRVAITPASRSALLALIRLPAMKFVDRVSAQRATEDVQGDLPKGVKHYRFVGRVWDITRSARGVPVHRSAAGLAVSELDGRCYLSAHRIRQLAHGGGRFGGSELLSEPRLLAHPLEVPCDINLDE